MAINFHKDAFVKEFNFSQEKRKKRAAKLEAIPTSGKITGIEVRLSKVHISDNKTPKALIFPGYAKIYLLVIVVSDLENEAPVLNLKSFEKVADNESLAVDASIFYWKEEEGSLRSPSQIHALISIVKSKEGLRTVGEILSKAQEDEAFKKISGSFVTVVNNVAKQSAISSLLLDMLNILGKFLGNVDDKPLFTWVQSFTDINGDFDVLGKTNVSRKNKWVEANLSVIVRDKDRELEVARLHDLPIDDLE